MSFKELDPVNSLVSDHPWGTTKWSLTGKINKIGLILDRLINYIKNITLPAKIRQIETNLFDFFHTEQVWGKVQKSVQYLTMCLE